MPVSVLIVDRQVATRRMLRFALEIQDVRIAEADGAAAALALLERGQIDLMIIGFENPDEENVGIIDQVRGRDGLEELPILLVSDRRHRAFRNLRELGRCAWLDKPFRVTDVHERVGRLIDIIPRPASPVSKGNHGHSGA